MESHFWRLVSATYYADSASRRSQSKWILCEMGAKVPRTLNGVLTNSSTGAKNFGIKFTPCAGNVQSKQLMKHTESLLTVS